MITSVCLNRRASPTCEAETPALRSQIPGPTGLPSHRSTVRTEARTANPRHHSLFADRLRRCHVTPGSPLFFFLSPLRADGAAGCPSGQRERSVKPSAQPTQVQVLHLPHQQKQPSHQRKRGAGAVLVCPAVSGCHRRSTADRSQCVPTGINPWLPPKSAAWPHHPGRGCHRPDGAHPRCVPPTRRPGAPAPPR